MKAIAATLAAGGIGRPFFCALRLPGAESEAAAALALAEPVLGRVEGLEARRAGRHFLVLARHASLALTQIVVSHHAAPAVELDGETGSLRLIEDVLLRHCDRVEPVPLDATADPRPDASRQAALAAALRQALRDTRG